MGLLLFSQTTGHPDEPLEPSFQGKSSWYVKLSGDTTLASSVWGETIPPPTTRWGGFEQVIPSLRCHCHRCQRCYRLYTAGIWPDGSFLCYSVTQLSCLFWRDYQLGSATTASKENRSVPRRNAMGRPSPYRFHGVCGGSYGILPIGSCFCFPLGKSLQDKAESSSGWQGTRWGLWSQIRVF